MIRKAKADLEAEHDAKARAKAEQAAAKRGADQREQAAAGDEAVAAAVVPAKAHRSFTDPDARIMKTSDGSFHYCYNAQTVVDEDSQIILSTRLVPSGADSPELPGRSPIWPSSCRPPGSKICRIRCWPTPGTSARTTSRRSPRRASTR